MVPVDLVVLQGFKFGNVEPEKPGLLRSCLQRSRHKLNILSEEYAPESICFRVGAFFIVSNSKMLFGELSSVIAREYGKCLGSYRRRSRKRADIVSRVLVFENNLSGGSGGTFAPLVMTRFLQ